MIDEEWIRKANGYIRHMQGDYRDTAVYIGNLSEAVYYPPDPQDVPELMKSWLGEVNIEAVTVKEIFEKIAVSHIRFERIHPFLDGNGRTGRMVVNQQLINNGLLPVSIQPTGKYREAFRRYDKKNDLSEMVILSRLVDTFISRISLTMLPVPNPHNTVCVLSWEEARHWQSRSSGYSSS